MKQPNNTMIYNTALYLRLSRDDELQGESGTIIPMLFHKIHIDPAVASGPLITTINDLVAVMVYYGLAMVVLIDLFHLG